MKVTDLTQEDLELIDEALHTQIDLEVGTLEATIDADQTPETIEEFMDVVSTLQDKIAALEGLQQRLEAQRAD